MVSNKKIVIVSSAFYPFNSPRSFRATELAKEFSRQGHKVTIITPRYTEHTQFEEVFGVTIKDMGQPKWKPIELKGAGINLFLRRIFKRFTGLLFEYPRIEFIGMVMRALKNEKNYDILISIAVPYPIHWGVAAIWKKNRKNNLAKKWIADCGDPYMGENNDSFRKPFYFKYVEKWFMRKVDYIAVPTEGSINGYYPEFHSKIKVIPQGFRFEDIKVYKGEKQQNHPVFAYPGMFIPGRRDPTELFEYLCTLPEYFEFFIYTSTTKWVEPYIEKSKGRIQLKPMIPREELLYELSKMDFMVNFENADNKQTPSKLIDYIIINKPILSVKTGALNTEIIGQFFQRDYSSAKIIENTDQYRIENVYKEFINLV